MKITQIDNVLSKLKTVSKWELDSVVYYDRTSNLKTLSNFLIRIQSLQIIKRTPSEQEELGYLLELLEDLDEDECLELSDSTDEDHRISFIENLARISAIEILTGEKYSSKCDVFSVGIVLYELVLFIFRYLESILFIQKKRF